jgi:hypothetical protein
MKKRILAAILSALLLLPSLAACSAGNDPADTGKTAQTAAEDETQDPNFPDFDKKDYKGETFRILNRGIEPGTWYYSEEYMTEGKNIHVLNNTIYEMNTMVEDFLNINIEYKAGGSTYSEIYPSVMAGDDLYQAVFQWAYWDITNFILKDIAMDLRDLDSLNFDKPYWNRDVMDMLSIGDHYYVGMGDICYQSYFMLYTNKDLLRQVNRKMPYEDVRAGTWTLDKLIALTADLYADNGDGVRNNLDVYGFAADWNCFGQSLAPASGLFVSAKNKDGDFELTLYSDRLVELVDKCYTWTQNESSFTWYYAAPESQMLDFAAGRTYVTAGSLGPTYLSADFKVGILPLPKYDASQESYAHLNWGNSLNVPKTVKNPELVGDALELMSYYTRTIVLTKYYDEVLQLRVSEAPDDRDMVELIYNTVVFDPGFTYCDGSDQLRDLHNLVYGTIITGNANVASYYQSRYRSAEKWLKKLNQLQ